MQHTSRSLGTLVIATRVVAAYPGPWRTRSIIMCLAASCALMMIGFGISTPVFAKRLGELGSGVESLGFMTMASALAQFLLAPCTGTWADRFGRRPFVLLALAGLTITNLAFLSAQSVSLFIALLLLDFVAVFGMEFLEPQMVFYLYKTLALTPAQYGFIMGSYGLALLFGQAGLGRLGERLGKKPMIALGFLLTSALPLGLLLFHQLALLILVALLAGLGSALITPALESSYLDMTPEQHRSLIMGVRESAVSLGAVVGPLLLAFSSRWLSPQSVFTVALLAALAAVILTLAVLKLQGGRGARSTERDTSERAVLVFSTLYSILEEVQVMRQPTSLLAEAENTADLTLRSTTALSEWH